MATKRACGMKALLKEISNEALQEPRAKRSCASKAATKLRVQALRAAPRDPTALKPEPSNPPAIVPAEYEGTTLKDLVKHMPHVAQGGMDSIQGYIERNTMYSIQKACALRIFAGCVLSGHGVVEALDLAAACTPFSSRTIRRWASDLFTDYFLNLSNLDDVTDERLDKELESGRGRHPKLVSQMSDEGFRRSVKKYVLDNGYMKGKPNLTSQQVATWLKEEHSLDVCTSTVSLWLHDLGFSYKQFSKGVNFDGHEREDVVKDRSAYLAELQSCSHRMWFFHSPFPNPQCRPLIRVFQDESTFYSNADQAFFWSDGSKQTRKQKLLGQSVMVSDFIDEVNGFLQYDDRKAHLLLETQSDGYFNNEMLLEQVDEAITIFEDKYPECQGMFIFDNAPSHMKGPDDALNVEKMNVKDGGKQPFMKDTIWNGNVQKMVTAEGIQKGQRTVLGERGINTDGMVAEKLRSILRQHKVRTVFIIVTTFYSYNVTLTLMSNNCKHSSNKSSTKLSYPHFEYTNSPLKLRPPL